MNIIVKKETKDIKQFRNYFKELVLARGITDESNWDNYYNPTEKNEHNPLNLKNIEEAYRLLINNLDKKIGFLVDSDSDGFCSASLLLNYLLKINKDLNYVFFVHEGKEHGLKDSVNFFIKNYCNLVIVPDAGTNDVVEQEKLYNNSIDLIILDHHESEKELEDNDSIAIVNPQLDDYPNKALSGGGVVLKFIQYLDTKFNVNYSNFYYDLAATSIISDMLDITTLENRWIIVKGLREFSNPFLKAAVLKQSCLVGEDVNPQGISFYIAPLINSLIRFGTKEQKEKLFTSMLENEGNKIVNSQYQTLAEEMVEETIKTKNTQDRIVKRCFARSLKEIEKEGQDKNEIIICQKVLKNEDEKAVNGLIAMNLTAHFKKPVLYLVKTKNGLQGSARNCEGHPIENLKDYLNESGLVNYAQGHGSAFGVSINEENIPILIEKINNDMVELKNNTVHYVDFMRDNNDEDIDILIENLGANDDMYGKGNPKPEIAIELNINARDIKIKGTKKDTSEITFDCFSVLKFMDKDFADLIDTCKIGKIVAICEPSINFWNNKIKKQLNIKQYELQIIEKKPSEEEFFII